MISEQAPSLVSLDGLLRELLRLGPSGECRPDCELYLRSFGYEVREPREAGVTPAAHIQRVQREIWRIRDLYEDDTLRFAALLVAWEALRVAWYAVARGSTGDHLPHLERAMAGLQQMLGQNCEQ